MEITIETLRVYKEQWHGHKIIYVRFLDSDFVFRTLTRSEYRFILQQYNNQLDLEDAVCNLSCIYPEDYDFSECEYAGIPDKICQVIQKQSGFLGIQDVMSDFHKAKENTSLELQCMDLIKAFIPEYTYEEMETWTWQQLMEITARAEAVCKLRGFDWEIKDNSEEYVNKMNEIVDIDNKEFIKELQNKGIDPMFYFKDQLPPFKQEIIDFPLISGGYWNSEEMLSVIREKIRARQDRR